MLSDGIPIGSGTLAGDLGGITIWSPWSSKSDANLGLCLHTKSVFILPNSDFSPIGCAMNGNSWTAKQLLHKCLTTALRLPDE